MIKISDYKSYWEHVLDELTADGLKYVALVATEEGLGKKIKDIKEFPALISIIPSSDPVSPNTDTIGEMNSGMIFVLMKRPQSDQSDSVFLSDMDTTQELMKKVKELMTEDKTNCDAEFHLFMKRLDVQSMHQDPEYNYLGCNGWSLSFQFETLGF